MKVLYEVRVRENLAPNKWMKKSKFYNASSPGEARALYRGGGYIMWVEKVSREKLMGIGEFFSMGNKLMKEFAEDSNGHDTLLGKFREEEKERHRKKRFSILKHRGEEVS